MLWCSLVSWLKVYMRSADDQVSRTEYRVQNTEYRIRNTEYGIQNTEYKIQNTEYRDFILAASLLRLRMSSVVCTPFNGQDGDLAVQQHS